MGYIFDAIRRADRDAPRATPADHSAYPGANEIASAAPIEAVSHTVQAERFHPLDTLAFHPDVADDETISGLDERLVAATTPDSLMAEEYRAIRTTLLARCNHKRHLVHTITSATPQEGKTITSLNLGLSFGELRNRSTVVVEADLRLPTFTNLLGLPQSGGLVSYLRGETPLSDALQRIDGSRLYVLPAGERCGAEAIQLLSGQRMAELLKTLRAKFDHVIVDTPPVIELADAGILGTLSDEVMLVVRMGRTPRPLVEQAIRSLRGYHAPVSGVIATDHLRPAGRHYYRYGYRYQYAQRRAA